MRRLRPLLPLVVLAALLSAFVAGCGGATGKAGSGPALAPADATMFLTVDTDASSPQLRRAIGLLMRFPSGGKLLDKALLKGAGSMNVDDLAAAVGPQLDVVALGPPNEKDAGAVALVQPRDQAKLARLLDRSGEQYVQAEVNGWTAIAKTQAQLDRFKADLEQGTLADSSTYQDAMAGLPSDALARIYVNAQALRPSGLTALAGGGALAFGGAVTAETNGLRFEGFTRPSDLSTAAPYAPTLPAAAPAGTAFYVSFNHADQALATMLDTLGRQSPSFGRSRAQAEALLGLTLKGDVLPLFHREGALAVVPGGRVPALALVLLEPDPVRAAATVDKLVAGANRFMRLGRVQNVEINHVHAHQLRVKPGLALTWAGFDGRLVLATSPAGVAAFVPNFGGQTLTADPNFRHAVAAAGMPGKTTGFVYLDFAKGVPLVEQLGRAFGAGPLPKAVHDNTAPLGALLVYTTPDNGRLRVSGFLGIE